MTLLTCKVCGGFLALLGQLGNLIHLRCQDCGLQHSVDARKLPNVEVEND